MKYLLKKPVSVGEQGTPVTELNFREEVCSGDYRGVKASAMLDPEMDVLIKVAGRLCGQPDAVMNRLGNADTWEVARIVSGFLLAGLETGNPPSP